MLHFADFADVGMTPLRPRGVRAIALSTGDNRCSHFSVTISPTFVTKLGPPPFPKSPLRTS